MHILGSFCFYHDAAVNLRGEPIATTLQNAYSTFVRSELDLLVMGDCLIAKKKA